MVEEIRNKHDEVEQTKSLTEKITDPFGQSDYTNFVEGEATQAEIGRVKARMESSHAQRQIEMLTRELDMANASKKAAEEDAARAKKLAEAARKAAVDAMEARNSIKVEPPAPPAPAPEAPAPTPKPAPAAQ